MTNDLKITFDDNLVTGNKTIDAQHKELIDRIQNFVTACQNGDSKVKAIKMLDYLDEYTDFHFKDEEKLQEKAGYPEREKHHEKHEEFKKTIQELHEYLQDYEGPTSVLLLRLLDQAFTCQENACVDLFLKLFYFNFAHSS